jgi:hypothetical protein
MDDKGALNNQIPGRNEDTSGLDSTHARGSDTAFPPYSSLISSLLCECPLFLGFHLRENREYLSLIVNVKNLREGFLLVRLGLNVKPWTNQLCS